MCNPRPSVGVQDLFHDAYPMADRAAAVRSANVLGVLRDATLDPDDLKQEALVGIWVALPRFDPARACLRTFVERVAANRMTSFIRGLHSGHGGLGKNDPLDEFEC